MRHDLLILRPLDAVQPEALAGAQLARVQLLCASPRGVKFYQSGEWRRLRDALLAQHHHECLLCRARGKYARAEMVHHVWFLDKRPELALARFYYSGGIAYPQLVPLCHACHEEAHGHRHALRAPVTPERW